MLSIFALIVSHIPLVLSVLSLKSVLSSVFFHRLLGKPSLPHSLCPQVFSSSSGLMLEVLLEFSHHPLIYGGGCKCSLLHSNAEGMGAVWFYVFLFLRRVKEEGFWNEVTVIILSIQKLFLKDTFRS